MRSAYKYGVHFVLLAILFAACNQHVALPSLKETFSKTDKDPFGCYVFYDQLQLLYNRNAVHNKNENFDAVWQNINDTNALYISISKNLFLSPASEKAMLSYVDNGNDLFISSQHIDSTLLDSLGCKVVTTAPMDETLASMKYTHVTADTAVFAQAGAYSYFYLPLDSYFKEIDTTTTNVLGKNDFGKPNFIEIFYGKGKVYLHCEPRVFSNYFLLQKKNNQYLQAVFAFTGAVPEHVYWDDYYSKRNYKPNSDESKTGLALLLQYPAMAWAFWLLMLLLGVYILFGGKRRQRIVETIAPNMNTTVAFTETVGHLYLQKKDNRNIADKMIMYFQEYIRKQYYLNTSQVNDDFITTLSRKGNVSKEETTALFTLIGVVQQSDQISDEALLLLNKKIAIFYKTNI